MSLAFAKRFEAVFLCTHPKGPKMSFSQAAKYIKKSKYFVEKWNKHYAEHKNVDDLPNRGVTRKTSKKDDLEIRRLFEAKPTISLRKAREKLSKKGINVSINTIRNRLQELQIAYRATKHKPLLTQKQVEKRQAWAHEHLEYDWSSVVFTDESSFWVCNTIRRAWSEKGNFIIQRTVKHPAKLHVWGCFS